MPQYASKTLEMPYLKTVTVLYFNTSTSIHRLRTCLRALRAQQVPLWLGATTRRSDTVSENHLRKHPRSAPATMACLPAAHGSSTSAFSREQRTN